MTDQQQQQIFTNWLSQYKALIFKIVRAYGDTPMDQEDLFQEISVNIWRSVPMFKGEAAVSTWLYRIALNTAIRWMGKQKKYRTTNTTTDQLPDTLLYQPPQTDDRLTWLYKAIHELDEIDRSVILLLLDGFSYKEMASILGISESNVGVKINRIKKHLSTKVKNNNHGI